MDRDTSHQNKGAQSPVQPDLEHVQGGEFTASLGNPLQCLTTGPAKNACLKSNPNLPSSRLNAFPLVLSLYALVISPPPALLSALRYWNAAVRSPRSLPFAVRGPRPSRSCSCRDRARAWGRAGPREGAAVTHSGSVLARRRCGPAPAEAMRASDREVSLSSRRLRTTPRDTRGALALAWGHPSWVACWWLQYRHPGSTGLNSCTPDLCFPYKQEIWIL